MSSLLLDIYAPGVYRIRNLITNQLYIGSSAGRSGMGGRFAQHKTALRQNKHANAKLQNSWNKYGESNFAFEVVEFCQKRLATQREQYYLDTLNPYFNILPNAANRLGSKFTQATLEKLKGRIPWNKGFKKTVKKQKLTEEQLEISKYYANLKRSKAMKGKSKNPEIVEKIAKKRRKPVIAINLFTNEKINFPGIRIAAKTLKLDVSMISKVCLKKYKYYKDWTFIYGC